MCLHNSACILRSLVVLVLLGHVICTSNVALSTDTQQHKVSSNLNSVLFKTTARGCARVLPKVRIRTRHGKLCNSKELGVLILTAEHNYICLYYYKEDIITTCFGPICGPSSGCDLDFWISYTGMRGALLGSLGGGVKSHYTNGYHGPGFPGGISFVVCSAHFPSIQKLCILYTFMYIVHYVYYR